ncbi:hypothetical protein [Streptomyces sp. NPDC058254]|uniref:zinc finger domain-containing protein n=1 Tax=Streptomyces sp. NPDC058254 TaxID=3346406 RepID=UPI0036E3AEE0
MSNPDLNPAITPALNSPALAVACDSCGAQPGDLCTSHSGTRVRRNDVHRVRSLALKHAEAQAAAVRAEPQPADEPPAIEVGQNYRPTTENLHHKATDRIVVRRLWTADDGHDAVAYDIHGTDYAGRDFLAHSACPIDVFRRSYRPDEPERRADAIERAEHLANIRDMVNDPTIIPPGSLIHGSYVFLLDEIARLQAVAEEPQR